MKKDFTVILLSLLFLACFTGEAKAETLTAHYCNDVALVLPQDSVFKDYRGVTLGMSAADVRQKLGKPEDQSDAEDSFEPAKGETLRIIYNAEKKVRMMSIMFTESIEKAPTPQALFGEDAQANEGGGVFKRMDFTEQGFWISYAKIAGDNPMIVITVQSN